MPTVYDAPADELIAAVAERLAEREAVEPPEWASVAKTGAGRELPPEQEDFWYRRAASLLRKVSVDGPVGVGALRTEYGGTKEGSTRYRVAPTRRTADGQSLLDETAGDVLEELDRPDLERYA